VSKKKQVKFPKYQTFKHTTESKKKNMVGNNPEVLKRKSVQTLVNPTYTATTTESVPFEFTYTVVPGKGTGE
jgi:hypothetical protein